MTFRSLKSTATCLWPSLSVQRSCLLLRKGRGTRLYQIRMVFVKFTKSTRESRDYSFNEICLRKLNRVGEQSFRFSLREKYRSRCGRPGWEMAPWEKNIALEIVGESIFGGFELQIMHFRYAIHRTITLRLRNRFEKTRVLGLPPWTQVFIFCGAGHPRPILDHLLLQDMQDNPDFRNLTTANYRIFLVGKQDTWWLKTY